MKKLVISTVAAAALIAAPFTTGKADAAELHQSNTKVVYYQSYNSDNVNWCKQILAKYNIDINKLLSTHQTNSNKQTTNSNKQTTSKQTTNEKTNNTSKTTQQQVNKQQVAEKPAQKPTNETTTNTKQPTQQTTKPVSSAIPQLSAYEQQVVDLTNQERAKNGLAPLTADLELSRVAREKSKDMSTNNYFDHTSPTYGSPFDMMKSYGIKYKSAGENIAKGQKTPQEVVTAWMNSSGHRANILNSSYTHIGVGYAENGNYWTQQFIGK